MTRRFFLMLSLMFATAIITPATAQAETLFVVDTNDGYLNLRIGPSTNDRIITRIYGGTQVDGVGQSGSWRRIVLPDGTSGWASGNYLTRNYTRQRPYDSIVGPTNDGYLNLRTGPGTNYKIIQRLYYGQGLFETGYNGTWAQVTLADGTRGWVSVNYIY